MEAAATAATSTPAPSPAPAATPAPETGAATSTPAPAQGATTATPPPAPEVRRHKLKVDGQDLEVDEEELKRGYQSRASIARRFEEVAKARKEVEAQQAALKKRLEDPRVVEASQKWGLPPEDAAALLRAQELMEREQMDPNQRALYEERQRREEAERKAKEFEEQQTQAKMEAETQRARAQIEREVVEAADKAGLPKSPRVGKMMLQHMRTMADAGQAPDAHESARFVMDSLKVEVPALIGALNDEQLETFLGKPIVDRILARSIAKAKGLTPPPPPPEPKSEEKPRPAFLSVEEWRKQYR